LHSESVLPDQRTSPPSSPISILYIGANFGTSRHRAQALRRLGHDVFIIDPHSFLPKNQLAGLWTWKTGGLFLGDFIRRRVLATIPHQQFDLVLVNGGELVGPSFVRELKRRFGPVVSYQNDDPFGGRDGRRSRLYLQALREYDLAVVVRDCNVMEARTRGARNVMRVFMSGDELEHAPREITREDREKWSSEVLFIGTWMPERGPFMARLLELGVPLSIYGNRWDRAAEWPLLRQAWRGPGLESEEVYARAIQCAKVCLGLLSKENRDMTTQRSFEIPLLGSVLCAERTPEHTALYEENLEAVFWSTPEECAEKCTQLLKAAGMREQLAANGRRRCLQNGTTNEPTMENVVRKAMIMEKSPIMNIRSA